MTIATIRPLAATLAAAMLLATPLAAQEAESFDIEAAECGDIMILSGIDRDTTLAFMHGYIVGKDGMTGSNATKLAEATDAFMVTCIDSPDANATQTLRDAVPE